MGKTFETLKLSVRDWLGVTTARLSETAVGDIINIVQHEITRKYETKYNEYTDTFVTVAGTYIYPAPSNLSKIYSIWYIAPSVGKVLFLNGPLDKGTFDTIYPDPTNPSNWGDVCDYAMWGGNFWLGYTPNAVLTLTRNYYRILPDLVDDVHGILDTNPLIDGAWEVLLFNCLTYATKYLIEDSRASMWEVKARDMLSALIREDSRARSIGKVAQAQEPGTLAPYPFWFNPQATP